MMRQSKEEKERKYYNRKLIKEGFKSELKKPHKIDWKQFIINAIGIFLGLTLINVIKTDNIIRNSVGRFVVEVLIITVAIMVVNAVIIAAGKIIKGK